MLKYKILIYISLALSVLSAQNTAELDSLYSLGNNAMLQEDYQTAIVSYEQILEDGSNHPVLYYNLGNAFYRLNQIGNAVWAYEKGLQLDPRDKDLRFNLSLANTQVRDRIEMPQSMFILEQYRALKKSTTLAKSLI